ncbi:MAG: outer membrane protein [Planctomycetota bacterium]|jgi:hypothetical protein
MRCLFVSAVILALCNVTLGASFVEREFPMRDLLSLLPSQGEWDDEIPDEEPPAPGKEEQPPTAEPGVGPTPYPPPQKGGIEIQGRLGFMVPFLNKGEAYSPGFSLGLSGKIPMEILFLNWLRPSLDLGFTSSDGTGWEASSTLLLLNCDFGYDIMVSDPLRISVFACLGFAFEFLSGTETTTGGAEESVSEVNLNLLFGLGGSFGIALTDQLSLEGILRLTFPLGSRNVQGLILMGVSVAYAF